MLGRKNNVPFGHGVDTTDMAGMQGDRLRGGLVCLVRNQAGKISEGATLNKYTPLVPRPQTCLLI